MTTSQNPPSSAPTSRLPVFEILLVYVLLLGAYFRLTPYTEKGNPKIQWGILWGESQWMHPDERFLLFVGGDISPMKEAPVDPSNPNGPTKRVWSNLSDYFNTGKSNLNPNNKGYGFFVYGTLPIFLTRYVAEIAFNHHVAWNEIAGVGRPLSAMADWLVIMLVFLAASRLFNKRVGLLAAVFYSWAVLPIQLSHFYKEDTFTNLFIFLALYFAILVATSEWGKPERGEVGQAGQEEALPPVQEAAWQTGVAGEAGESFTPDETVHDLKLAAEPVGEFFRQPVLWYSLGFGFALGCAMASKILAAPVALMLPVAFIVRLFTRSVGAGSVRAGSEPAPTGADIVRASSVRAGSEPAPTGADIVWADSVRASSVRAGSEPAPTMEERKRFWVDAALFVVLAAIVSVLIFRIFQPYAFKGPSFFNIGINKMWLEGIMSQRSQTDFPPAMQWARRPFTFALQNLTVWGLGLPLGLLAWAGFLAAGWRILKGDWQRYAVPWVWTIGYFAFQMWQSHFNPTMRYFLPMYPTLVIFAAWLLVWLYDRRENRFHLFLRAAAVLVGVFVLIYTLLYAYGFSRLYTRPITRLAASRWIYQNIPGPIDLHFDAANGVFNQPMPVPYNYTISKVTPYNAAFEAQQDGTLTQVSLNNLTVMKSSADAALLSFTVTGPQDLTTAASISIPTQPGGPENKQDYILTFDTPLEVKKGVMYTVILTVQENNVTFALSGDMVANEGAWDDGIPYPIDGYNAYGGIYPLRVDALAKFYTAQGVTGNDLNDLSSPNFNMYWDENNADKYQRFIRILDATEYIFITSNRQWGSLTRLPERFPMTTIYYRNLMGCPVDQSIVWCYTVAEPGMYQGNLGFELVATFTSNSSIGPFKLNDQFAEEAFTVYDHPKVLIFRKTAAYDSQKTAALLGSVDWTKTIHVFPDKAGSYPADLMLPAGRLAEQQQGGTWSELFNPQAIFNRIQSLGVALWYVCIFLLGLLTYPLVRLALHGLPDRGYPLARTAGMLLLSWLAWVAGSAGIPFTRLTITIVLLLMALAGVILGYFQRRELAEEWRTRRKYFMMIEIVALAFFLFDLYIRFGNPDLWHPWKGGEKPMDFSYFNAILKSTTFPPYDPWFAGGYLNYYYYGFVFVGTLVKWLGIVPSFAYNLILPTLFSLTAMGAFSVAYNIYSKWESTRGTTKDAKEGESPRKDAEGNTKELRIPLEATWAANSARSEQDAKEDGVVGDWEAEGGRLGEEADASTTGGSGASLPQAPPLPVRYFPEEDAHNPRPQRGIASWHISMPVKVGLMAGILMVVLGNLGTVGMIIDGLSRLGAPGGVAAKAPITTKISWVMQGAIKALKGSRLPYPPGDWYWIPSRVIPAQGDTEPITEFPFFTFLYADMHAHMMAMPVAFLALAWAVSLVLGPMGRVRADIVRAGSVRAGSVRAGSVRAGSEPAPTGADIVWADHVRAGSVRAGSEPAPTGEDIPMGEEEGRSRVNILSLIGIGLSFFLGSLASGALGPINLSDRYTYLALGAVAVAYSFWRFMDVDALHWLPGLPKFSRRLLLAAAGVVVFAGLSIALFQPYNAWYGPAYGSVDWWKGPRTPIWSYLTHWGLFLFIIVSWMFWETRDWMANTPLSSLRKLAPYVGWIYAALCALALLMVLQQAFVMGLVMKVYAKWNHVSIVWLAAPLAAWAGTLILRPGQPEAKRVVLFLVGTGLAITLVVDTIVVRGDIGRMNTVFKFYLQVWALFAVSAAAALGWLWGAIRDWLPSWRIPWKIFLVGLFVSAGLYTVIAGNDKITDRMARNAPHTLDGTTYMQYSTYDEAGVLLDLNRDYRAIRWAQENIKGSPVIVEAQTGNNYRWYNRFTIYTGLPSVLGWEWHQMQQRALLPSDYVHKRLQDIVSFYQTSDPTDALAFLQKYNVRYIIFGQLEQAAFPGPGLNKFAAQDGKLWRQVYPPPGVNPENETIIYEVIQP